MNLNIFKNKYLNWSKYFISPLILIYIIYHIGFGKILSTIQSFNVYYLLIAFLIFLFAFLLNFFTIYFLYKPLLRIPILTFFKYRGYSIAWGTFTPMRFGEFSLSIIFKKKYNRSFLESFTIILFDKVLTFIATCFIFCVSYFILVYFFHNSFLLYFQKYLLLILIIAFFSFLIFICSSYLHMLLLKIGFLEKSIKKISDSFSLLYKVYRGHLSAPLIDLLITFLSMIIIVVPSYILFNSLGFNINFIYLLFIASAASFFSLIPFTLSGLGIREVFVVYLYSLINVPAPVSLAMMLIFLFYRYLVSLLFIIIFSFSSSG